MIEARREFKDTDDMVFVKRLNLGTEYEIVVKASRTPIRNSTRTLLFSAVQVLDREGNEQFHELYPSILSEAQADKIIEAIKSDVKRFIPNGEEINNKTKLDDSNSPQNEI